MVCLACVDVWAGGGRLAVPKEEVAVDHLLEPEDVGIPLKVQALELPPWLYQRRRKVQWRKDIAEVEVAMDPVADDQRGAVRELGWQHRGVEHGQRFIAVAAHSVRADQRW